MSSSGTSSSVDVLDASIVVLPAAPLTQLDKAPVLFESDELKPFMKTPKPSQGLQLDAATGNLAVMLNFESMPSQRTVQIGAGKVEVHDRSGRGDFDAEAMARIVNHILRELDVKMKAVGANFEVTFPQPGGRNAAMTIASELFRERNDLIPNDMQRIGGTAHVFLTHPNKVRYTLVIEPRFNSLETHDIFISSNANLEMEEVPTIERFMQLIEDNRRVVRHVATSLFEASW